MLFGQGKTSGPQQRYRTVLGLSYSLVSLGSFTLKDQQVANNVELVAYNSSVYYFGENDFRLCLGIHARYLCLGACTSESKTEGVRNVDWHLVYVVM